MPSLNWDAFAKLPGSVEGNFEQLCRGVIRLNFGSYGVLRALANQPGVEFHLKLVRPCDALGDPGRWWGWQSKWYSLPTSGRLGSTRRKQIEECIRKTEAHVSGITDWVLWTRRPLASNDQKWFYAIPSEMTLHAWTEEDLKTFLGGQAGVLRATYFGELVLTPEVLQTEYEQAVAPIRTRWQPEVHQASDAEYKLRRMLGDFTSWDELRVLAEEIRSTVRLVEDAPDVPSALAPLIATTIEVSGQFADVLDRVGKGISNGDLDLLRDDLTSQPSFIPPDLTTAVRALRSGNHLAGLHVTNSLAGCREALRLLASVDAVLSTSAVAVLAPAGCGKTQLAAQLTMGTERRPHGVLLHGRDLRSSHTLDDLARRVSIAAQPVQSMKALLAAVDAAGQRARHRLPVVIDGLNESEDPRVWKRLLAELDKTLTNYPYVLLVCTLRPGFANEALEDGIRRLEIQGFGAGTLDAIRAHFRHYGIEAKEAPIPVALLQHPLTLRLFCEVTNPTPEKVVGLDAMPGSLTALFDRYLEQVAVRVAELAPLTHRYLAQDVRKALTEVASCLWERRAREVSIGDLRRALGDEGRTWHQSLVRALEQEGVLLRMPTDEGGSYAPAYDLLGGHLIATMLLARQDPSGFEFWIREPTTTTSLAGAYENRHPLAEDIVASLVGQVPRRFHSKQLWQQVDEPLRSPALRATTNLEATYLDSETVGALLDLVRQGDPDLLNQLRARRGTARHPLNAEALDAVLRPMSVADRDLNWTEWLRSQRLEVLRDLEYQELRWKKRETRASDRLLARWIMWTLTSTVRRLRDQATRSLYWFGRVDPEGLFELTIESLAVNDAYVSERMLASSYGVVMANQQEEAKFTDCLAPFLDRLARALVDPSATAPTNHYMSRLYVRGIVEFARRFCRSALPTPLGRSWSFGTPAPVSPIAKSDPRADEAGQTLHMDFENYTLGRLFDGRSNYDMDHGGHQAAVSHVRGVVWELGWRASSFGALDVRIAQEASAVRIYRPQAERYGKKYGWIGFFTFAGTLEEKELLPRNGARLSDVDIDPSFPEAPISDGDGSIPQIWLSPAIGSDESWVCDSATRVPRELLVRREIEGQYGPWLAVHGFVKAEDRVLGREAWAFVSAFVISKESLPRLEAGLKEGIQPWEARETPSDYYTFAGEIPWHPDFATDWVDEAGPGSLYRESLCIGTSNVEFEILAHEYAWESYHNELNDAGGVRVPSRTLSAHFDLRSVPQRFDQFLADGTRAAITLNGVDGLLGDVLYLREDLLQQYVGKRGIAWLVSGERDLRLYPAALPQWLVDAKRQRANQWREVISEEQLGFVAARKKPN